MRIVKTLAWRWSLAADEVEVLIEKHRDFVFDPALITCPTLPLVREGESQNEEISLQHGHALEILPNPQERLIIGPIDEGAAHHCFGENVGLMSTFVFDWLDGVFGVS
jgi:hypothetical protein